MKFTNSEILKIQEFIVALKVPIIFESVNSGKILLTFKNDPDVYLELTRLILYGSSGRLCDGTYTAFGHTEFSELFNVIKNWIFQIRKENPNLINNNELIKQFSPRFYLVFQEAVIIDNLGFKESAGMIFRKALEIIIKDFLLSFLPQHEEIILNETIGGIVHVFYEEENELKTRSSRNYRKTLIDFSDVKVQLDEILPLINFVFKTFKIGNDFSHYERKLEKYSTKDLQNNINEIVEYIETKYTIIQRQKKLIQIGSKFDSFKL